ncbi:MAG: RsmB/NOP family class I SAM-dependent RNA methyltransferase [Pseudomonadota bacterium]
MHHIHIRQSADLLHAILTDTLPADVQMERYFRAHREMGMRDRGEVAGTVYACLREKRLLEHLCQGGDFLCLTAADRLRQGISARAIGDLGEIDLGALTERVRTLKPESLPLAVRYSLPDWLADSLVAQHGAEETGQLAQALNRQAPVDLRVNTLLATRDEVRAKLAEEGYDCERTPYSSIGLRRATREPLFRTAAFKAGLFEVQDEGSQLLSIMLEPKRQEQIVDFCAGAGGKTLAIGQLTANTGSVYAFDISAKRLERLKPRLRRSGLQNVRTAVIRHERDDRVRRLAGKIDRVLVDAPCSGTGTLRRNPDIKWRTIDLPALVADQKNILEAAASLVKPGGRLVYATCSLMREENEEVAADFQQRHPQFRTVPANDVLTRRHIALTMPDNYLRLSPHRHGTDGFFAAIFDRGT